MVDLAPEYRPHRLESDARALWAARRFPAANGTVGTASGPIIRQLLGSFYPGDRDEATAIRAVAADADARYLSLAGRVARGTLRAEAWRGFTLVDQTGPVLESLGVWTGGSDGRPWEMGDRHALIQRALDRLARTGILVTHDAPLRVCPICAAPRSPDQIVYQSEGGVAYLVRFLLRVREKDVHALVWLDAPWRLLGTSALLVHPDLPYAIARFRRRGVEELILASRSALERIHAWIAGSEVEAVDELPGRELAGIAYDYPLRHEFPTGGSLTPPAGTVQPVREVGDSGTGIVPLVPGHGGTDAPIAERLHIPGWPLVNPRGHFDLTILHKYSGLDLNSGSDFVLRDLREGGAVFAELKVRRGVPHCSVCGTPLLWVPGRAWRLELPALPVAQRETFARLLPHDPTVAQGESAIWPVSDTTTTEDPTAPMLTECTRCERLDAGGSTGPCACGGPRRSVRRSLLPSIAGALAAWTREDPFPSGEPFRLYLARRRAAPQLVHHLVAMAGLDARLGELNLTLLPTVHVDDLAKFIEAHGADAVRAALLSLEASTAATAAFADRCAQEHARLSGLWATARAALAPCDAGMISTFARPIGTALEELEPEDLAILARFERVRVQVLAEFEHWNAAGAERRLFRFLESDFVEYRRLVAPRLELAGMPTLKRAALRTTVHLLRGATVLFGPIAPHTAEGIHRAIAPERPSVFDEPPLQVDRVLLDDERARAWDRWESVLGALAVLRRDRGLAPTVSLPQLALVLDDDGEADRYRAERPALERLARVAKIVVGSPREPWTGRQRQMRPVESEIQRVYPREASQIVHVLRRMPARLGPEVASRAEMSIIIGGTPRLILPSMVENVDVLPDRVVPVRWSPGEMYVELPASADAKRSAESPLSADAQWVVQRLARRLDAAPDPEASRAKRTALIVAAEPLTSELASAREGIERTLGIGELRVTSEVDAPPPPHRIHGRTRTGSRWWAYVPGLPSKPRSAKPRRGRRRAPRAPTEIPPNLAAPPELDYADEAVVAQGQRVRELGDALDTLLGAPLLGPSKVARAWDAGFQSIDDYRAASYDALVALPGFGRPLASTLILKLGGTVPPPPARTRRYPPRGRPARPTAPPPPSLPSPAPSSARAEAPVTPNSLSGPPPATEPPRETVAAPPESEPAPGPELDRPPSPTPQEESTSTPPEPAPIEAAVSVPLTWNRAPDEAEPPALEEPTGSEAPPEDQAPVEIVAPSAPQTFEAPAAPEAETPIAEPTSTIEPAPEAAPTVEGATETEPLERPEAESRGVDEEGEDSRSNLPAPPPAGVESPLPTGAEEPTAPETVLPPLEEGAIELPDQAPPERPSPEAEPSAEPPGEAAPEVEPVPSSEPPIPAGPEEGEETTSAPQTDLLPPGGLPNEPQIEPLVPPKPPEPPEVVSPPTAPPGPPTPPAALPPEPPTVAPEVAPTPPSGGIEIEVGTSFLPSLQRFLDASAAGHQGVCVVRESPERVRAYVGGRPVEIHWLTNFGHGATLKPGDLPGLEAFFEKSLTERRVTIFFLEGVEYLVRIHGLERVVSQLAAFEAVLRSHDGRAWIYVNPKLLSDVELRALTERFASAPASGPGAP